MTFPPKYFFLRWLVYQMFVQSKCFPDEAFLKRHLGEVTVLSIDVLWSSYVYCLWFQFQVVRIRNIWHVNFLSLVSAH